MHHNANSHWGWRSTMLRLGTVEGTVVFSGPISGSHDQSPPPPPSHLGMQAGAVPTRIVPGHLIPGCVTRNPRRQTRTWKALRLQPTAPGSYTHRMWGALKRWHWFSMWFEESYPALWLPLHCLNHQPGYPNSYGMAWWEQALWQGCLFLLTHEYLWPRTNLPQISGHLIWMRTQNEWEMHLLWQHQK